MKIQKKYQGAIPLNRIANEHNESALNTYSTNYIDNTYLPLSGGVLTGKVILGQGDKNCLELGAAGHINVGNSNYTALGLIEENLIVGNGNYPLYMRGLNAVPMYNGYPLIEQGSNENGTWIKYADGTMICSKTVVLNGVAVDDVWGSLYYYADNTTYYFAQEFIDVPHTFQMSLRTTSGAGGWLGSFQQQYVTKAAFSHFAILRPTVNTVYGEVNVLAIGKWK